MSENESQVVEEENENGPKRGQMPDASHQGGDDAESMTADDEEVFGVVQAELLIKVFNEVTAHVVQERLMEDRSTPEIAREYVGQIAQYQQGLCDNGWDVHADIQKSGILIYTPTADMDANHRSEEGALPQQTRRADG